MKNLKLNIELLPRAAWGNGFSNTLSKKDWFVLRQACYSRANNKCVVCGYSCSDKALDAHEVWHFDIINKTQTLLDIIALCSRCHGVKHFRHSERLGYGENAKRHFMRINNCSELDFANCYINAQAVFEKQNEVYRFKVIADLSKFGGANIEVVQREIPYIENPYSKTDWNMVCLCREKAEFVVKELEHKGLQQSTHLPIVELVEVDNYSGTIVVKAKYAKSIAWLVDGVMVKKHYSTTGLLTAKFCVENLKGKTLQFIVFGGTKLKQSLDFNLSKIDNKAKGDI